MEPKIEVVSIGPTEAAELLEFNDRNRKIDWNVVTLYARQMSVGEWTFVGDPIRKSVTGRLLDGQNRLTAVVRSGTTQTFVLVSNLPDDSQAYMDVGKKRTPADVFALNEVPNAGTAAAICSIVLRYDTGRAVVSGYKVGTAEMLNFYTQNTAVVASAARIGKTLQSTLPVSPAVSGAVYVLASRVADAFAISEFFERLGSGLDLQAGNPIAAFRTWIIRRQREDLRVNRIEVFYMLARTWNAWARGESLQRVQLPRGGMQDQKLPDFVAPRERPAAQPTEDNPVAVPYSKTRAEMKAAVS